MSGIPFGLVGAAADELRNLFRDAQSQIEDGVPEWVKSGQPQSINGKFAQAAARQTCRRFAADPDSFGAFDRAKLPDLCRPFLGAETPDFQPVDNPSNGQCVGTQYVVTVESQGANGQQTACQPPTTAVYGQTGQAVIGPVRGVINRRGSIGPGGNTKVVVGTLLHGGPSINLGAVLATGCPTAGYRLVSVVPRPGGGPDNCPPPGPDIEPPGPAPVPSPPPNPAPYPFPPGPDIDIDIRPRPGGGWEICFEDICVYIDPFGDDGGGGGGGGGGGTPEPGDRGSPGGAQDSEDGPPEGEAPPGQVLTGVLVDAIAIDGSVNKTEVPNSVTVYRGVCYVLMGGEPGLELQPEGSTVIFPQFFEAPENSTKWRVVPNSGYRLSVTPYYKEVEEEE